MAPFLSVFVTSLCDVGLSDDSICKITSSVLWFFVINPASGRLNSMHE
jgi:hypothetical protein